MQAGQTSVSRAPRVWLVALCLAVHGCTTATGGAVELSWKLRPASGSPDNFVDCDGTGTLTDIGGPIVGTGKLTQIRLHWSVANGPNHADFACGNGHGVTGFDLPPGEELLSVVPLCNGVEAALDTYTASAPERRTVIVGNTVSLGAVELVLQVTQCALQPCICQ